MSRYFLGAMILSDTILDVVRRELRRLSPGVKIETEQIRRALEDEVIKREVVEGEKAAEARRKISRAQNRPLRKSKGPDEPLTASLPEPAPTAPTVSASTSSTTTVAATQPLPSGPIRLKIFRHD
jgi:hypothetical protein